MASPYRENECRDLTPEELQLQLKQFEQVAERAWVEEENPLFFYTWMFNLRRNCLRLDRPEPEWLESVLAAAPEAKTLLPEVVLAA